MRVAIAVNTLSYDSGIPNVVVGTANALARGGVFVGIVTLVPGRREDLDPAVPVVSVFPGSRGAFRTFSSRWTAAAAGLLARRALATLAPDVVVVHYPPLDRCFVRRRRRYRVVYYYHNVTDPSLYEGAEQTRRVREDRRILDLLPACDAVVTNSRFTAEKVRAALPGVEATVIHPGVDVERYKPLPVPPPARQIVSIGRIVPHKGILETLAAFARVKAAFPPVRLKLIGKNEADAYYARVMEAAAALEGVDVLGELPEGALLRELAASAAFVSCSRFEGFGMPYLEAAACGVPSVGFDVGGAGEAVVSGETGFLVPPGDVAAAADRIVALLTDGTLRRRMREKAIAHASRFDWNSRARAHLALFERLLSAR